VGADLVDLKKRLKKREFSGGVSQNKKPNTNLGLKGEKRQRERILGGLGLTQSKAIQHVKAPIKSNTNSRKRRAN